MEAIKQLIRKNKGLLSAAKVVRGGYRKIFGYEEEMWSRVVMNRETGRWIEDLSPRELHVLEISGQGWSRKEFKSYKSASFPAFDICKDTLHETFDLIIAEQVFEHVLWPCRAGKNVLGMLQPGGCFLITVPFLVRVHGAPMDCTRWTETGLRYFLAECGFPLDNIKTGSWGNRRCVEANYREWTNFYRRLDSLKNEPDFPFHVWALARKVDV